MTTNTSKITDAADDLSDKLTKGGGAAKTLGAEIANAIKSLDGRVAALESSGGETEPPPIQPPTTDTSGRLTEFSANGTKIDTTAWQCHSARKPYSLTKVDDYEVRFEVRQGERMSWDGDYCDRALLQHMETLTGNWGVLTPVGKVCSERFRLLIEPGEPAASYFFVLSQAYNGDHEAGVATSPPIALEFIEEKLKIFVRHCPSGQNPSNSAGNMKQSVIWTAAQTTRGVWYEIKIEAKNKNDSTGYCKVWLNGDQVANYTGPVGYGYTLAWTFGPYRATDPTVFACRYRNIVHTPTSN